MRELDGKPLTDDEISKGYEISKDTFVQVTYDEPAQMPLPTPATARASARARAVELGESEIDR
ncbi:hypothetical protein ACWGH4_20190 [Streptomyces sp. NPDC054847]